jgi:hypothetical protein
VRFLVVASLAILALVTSCNRSRHARLAAYEPAPLPAGFVPRSGAGWSIAVPSTWSETPQRGPAAWSAAAPQAVDDRRANANVIVEPFAGDSYDYATANDAALRHEPRATVESAHDTVVDRDPTLLIESHWTPAPPSSVPYHTMQSALAARGEGYVVTCSVAENAFERYRSTCESIVRSFAVER